MKYPQGLRLLVDGDLIKFRCAFACEKTMYLNEYVHHGQDGTDREYAEFPDSKSAKAAIAAHKEHVPGDYSFETWNRKIIQPEEFAYECVNTTLGSFASKFNPSSIDIYMSDTQTFRDFIGVTKKYKGNRDGMEKPKWYKEVGNFLNTKGAITLKDLEADDAISIAMSADPKGTVCVSIDKDMLQVPGIHYNWVKDEITTQTKKGADWALATQLLVGDVTDNIPGLPGVGPKAAEKLLAGARSSRDLFNRVLKAYEEYMMENWKTYFVEQYKLVRLLRTYEEKDSTPDLSIQEDISSLTKQAGAKV